MLSLSQTEGIQPSAVQVLATQEKTEERAITLAQLKRCLAYGLQRCRLLFNTLDKSVTTLSNLGTFEFALCGQLQASETTAIAPDPLLPVTVW